MRDNRRRLCITRFKRGFGLILAGAVAIAVPATAQSGNDGLNDYYLPDIEDTRSLDGQGLLAVFSGQTHRGTYSFLRKDIITYAFSETTYADGRVKHIQKSHVKEVIDSGQWEIEDDTICYDYDNERLRQACFRIYVVGNCYYHYQVSVEGFPASGFTARSVIKGERPDCEPSVA